MLDFAEDKLEFKEKDKSVKLKVSDGGHMLVRLELVGHWKDKDAVHLVKEEESLVDKTSIKNIHEILNHKTNGTDVLRIQECWQDE